MKRTLIDTSVWISFFRQGRDEALKEAVRDVLLEGGVHICWPVRAELLIGARTPKAFESLGGLLESMQEIPLGEPVWRGASELGFRLRRSGITVPLPDLLIAQCAVAAGCELWHADRHYETVAAQTRLATRSFLPKPS